MVPTNIKDLKDMEVALDVAAVGRLSPDELAQASENLVCEFCAAPMSTQVFERKGQQTTLAIPAAARRLGPMGPIFRGRFFPRYLQESGTKQFPEGRFPRPGMIPRGLDREEPSVRERCL